MKLGPVQKTLTKKLIQNKLAHLLHIQGNDNNTDDLMKWTSTIIQEYFFNLTQKNITLENNADVLIISTEKYLQKKFYDKKIVDDILKFLSHQALVGNKKFVIIDNLKYLSEIHMNKLLKTFEEPPIEMHLFLHNPSGLKAIQTVLSRAVTIHFPISNSKQEDKIEKNIVALKDVPMHKFIEKLKKDQSFEDRCAQVILDNASNTNNDNLINHLNSYLQTKTHDAQYNYSANERLISLYHCFELINLD